MKTKFLPILLLIVLVSASCSNFKEEAKPLFKHLNQLFEASQSKCEITQRVWYSAIYDRRYALSNSDKFDDYYEPDFNTAIVRMEKEKSILILNTKIDSLKSIVILEVEKIADKKNESYDKLISLYTNVIELSKIARNPTGNLQSYSNDIDSREKDISSLVTELQARNPEFGK